MSDVRALLLTDVVDSTRLAEKLGDAALADLWAEHDRAARDLLPQWRGREIDKTDGMLLLFDTAADAVGYALAYHRVLAGQSMPPSSADSSTAGSVMSPAMQRSRSSSLTVSGGMCTSRRTM